MHCIQTSGNCIRNVTADHFAGVAADEVADPRPYAEILRQWSSLHPEFLFLPRKFKIAVTGAPVDRAAIQFHDIGYEVKRNEQGELGFAVYIGGGMGRTPMLGKKIRDFLPEEDLLAYSEAILRVYNMHGRRDNKYKARIKILVHETGVETITQEIEAGVRGEPARRAAASRRKRSAASPPTSRLPPIAERPAASAVLERARLADPDLRSLGPPQCQPAPRAGLRDRHDLAEADRRRAGRRDRRRSSTPSPTSPSAGRSARSGSATSRTSSCRMSRRTI